MPPYRHAHVVINPAAGRDEPILNTLNDVFRSHGLDWSASVTLRDGDARKNARSAIAEGADLIVGYGGDGTIHEVVNAVAGTGIPLGVLPGGTWNGFALELGLPRTLREAAELICTAEPRPVDVARLGDEYFTQRMWVGIEPEQEANRAQKEKYGPLAYVIAMAQNPGRWAAQTYNLTVDGAPLTVECRLLYVVNSSVADATLPVDARFSITDGLLNLFILSSRPADLLAAGALALRLPFVGSPWLEMPCREVVIDGERDFPVWADGEYRGRTPATVSIAPGALTVVAPPPAVLSAEEQAAAAQADAEADARAAEVLAKGSFQ
jgi:diacylglycerol kinase (ATP)